MPRLKTKETAPPSHPCSHGAESMGAQGGRGLSLLGRGLSADMCKTFHRSIILTHPTPAKIKFVAYACSGCWDPLYIIPAAVKGKDNASLTNAPALSWVRYGKKCPSSWVATNILFSHCFVSPHRITLQEESKAGSRFKIKETNSKKQPSFAH